MLKLIELLWPFFQDTFLKNTQLRKPGTIARFFIYLSFILILLYGVYTISNKVLFNNYIRTDKLRTQLIKTEKLYEDKVESYTSLLKKCDETEHSTFIFKRKLLTTESEVERLKQKNEELRRLLKEKESNNKIKLEPKKDLDKLFKDIK